MTNFMNWTELRQIYPNQWLLIEALSAHTTADQQRHLEQLAVISRCLDGEEAFQQYRQFHRHYPQRELYFVHTGRDTLDIEERYWLGIHTHHATHTEK